MYLVSTISPNITDKTSSLTYDVRQVSVNEHLVSHFLHRTHFQIRITVTMKKYNFIDVIEIELYERAERDIGKLYADMLPLISGKKLLLVILHENCFIFWMASPILGTHQ